MAGQDNQSDIVARAQALIDEVQGQLAAGDAFYRSQGLDPEKVRQVMDAQLDLKGIEAAQKAYEDDMAAADQEAHEEMARQSFAAPSAGGVKRPRVMV
jgi:flagellar biosynthesis/type III secretory pathway M-ring protein FliF/YscJ